METFLEVTSEHPLTVRKIELSTHFIIKKVYRRSLTSQECSHLGEGWKDAEIVRVTLTNNEEVDVIQTSAKKALLKG